MTQKNVTLHLTEAQFLVIYEFLYHTKLGDRNYFESEISDLMQELDTDVTRFAIRTYEDMIGRPTVSAVMDEDGFSFQIE